MLDRLFVFFPSRELLGDPGDLGLEFEDIYFDASDGVRLHGWFIPGRNDTVMLWLHGNAGNISHRASNILMLHRLFGIGIFIFDYRGYGRSGGTPSEEGLYRDADAAIAVPESAARIRREGASGALRAVFGVRGRRGGVDAGTSRGRWSSRLRSRPCGPCLSAPIRCLRPCFP